MYQEIARLLNQVQTPPPADASQRAIMAGRTMLAVQLDGLAGRIRDDLARRGITPDQNPPAWAVWDLVTTAAAAVQFHPPDAAEALTQALALSTATKEA